MGQTPWHWKSNGDQNIGFGELELLTGGYKAIDVRRGQLFISMGRELFMSLMRRSGRP